MDKIIDTYYEQKKAGTDYSVIRKSLQEKEGLNDVQIRAVIDEIDHRIVVEDRKAAERGKIKAYRLVGWILMLGGGLFTAAVYFKWIQGQSYLFVSYLPVIVGYLLIVFARKSEKRL